MLPRLIHLYGPFWIHSYGVMIALGFFIFLALTLNHPHRKKLISSEKYLNVLFLGLIAGIVGGRTLFIMSEWNYYQHNLLEIFMPWEGGMTVLGSIIGVIITVPIYLRLHRINLLKLFDLAAQYAPLMQAIGRIGCLMAGCCHGKIAHHLSWAITFTNPEGFAPLHVPLHPTQLYLGIASLTIFFFLNIIAQAIAHKPGLLISIYLLLESISRFTIDFWRGDRGELQIFSIGEHIELSLSIAQIYSGVFFIFCLIAIIIISFGKQRRA